MKNVFARILLAAGLLSCALFAPIRAISQTRTVTTYTGAYSPTLHYHIGDMVTSGGITYVSLVYPNIGHTPASSPLQWGVIGGGGVAPSADITNAGTVTGLQGHPVSAAAPTVGQGPIWSGTAYVPTTPGAATLGTSAQGGALPVEEYVSAAHPPLAYWDAALHSCQSQIVRVQIHGESRDIVDSTLFPGISGITRTFAGRWANRLQAQLQGMCGSHGSGIVPFRYGTGTSTIFNSNYYPTTTGTFVHTDTALGPYQPDSSDPMLVTATTNGATINFATLSAFDHLLTYCVSGAGINPWTLQVDGGTVGTCGTASGSKTAVVATSSPVTLAVHTASIICASQPCEAYAMEGAAGTTGVSIDNFALGSASAEAFGQYPATQYAFSDLAPGGAALDILGFVTNEPGHSESTATFQTTLTNMVAHDRAMAYPPSVLLYSPIQDGIPSAAWYPIIKTVAQAQNTAFVDLRDRWGAALIPWLFGPDTYHENNLGDGEKLSAVEQTIIDIPPSPASFVAKTCIGGNFNSVSSSGVFSCSTPACGAGYAHHATFTPATASGGSDLATFPELLSFNGASANSITLTNLKTVANGGQVQSSAGLDVIFCTSASGGTQLPHELVAGSYTPSTGAGEWYATPSTVSSSAAIPITVFWGNAAAIDTSANCSAWANGYAAVYHGGISTSLSLLDSSCNGNSLTNFGATAAAGEFGGAFSVTASTYLIDPSPTGLSVGTSPRTLEAWAQQAAPGQTVLFGYGAAQDNFSMLYGGGNTFGPFGNIASVATAWGYSYTMNTAWHYYTTVLPGSSYSTTLSYVDGSPLSGGSCLAGPCTPAITATMANIQINGLSGFSSSYGGGLSSPGTGLEDELRISTVARTSGWIATQYANQSNPATFWTVGTIF